MILSSTFLDIETAIPATSGRAGHSARAWLTNARVFSSSAETFVSWRQVFPSFLEG
jgi:hypothetical protein